MNAEQAQSLKISNHIYMVITTMLFALMLFFALAFQNAASFFDNSIGMMASTIYQVELLINVPFKVDSAQTNKIQSNTSLSQSANSKTMTRGIPLAKSHAASVAEGTTSLYRSVSPSELADIKSTGQFINKGSALGKYFSTTAEGAASYAKQAVSAFGDEPYSLVSTQMQTSSISPVMQATVDGGISSVVVPDSMLSDLNPVIHGSMPIP